MTADVVGVLAEALAQHQHGALVPASLRAECGDHLACTCGWVSSHCKQMSARDEHREHVASAVAALPNIAIIEVPTDITPEPEDHTWFRVRGFDYYGGTDEDMPIDQIEAQAADILAIARYRRAARAAGGQA